MGYKGRRFGSPPYGADAYRATLGPSADFVTEKFIFVYQDVRGKFRSEGDFVVMRPLVPAPKGPRATDESTDTYDTIDGPGKNGPHNKGRVGPWGISVPSTNFQRPPRGVGKALGVAGLDKKKQSIRSCAVRRDEYISSIML